MHAGINNKVGERNRDSSNRTLEIIIRHPERNELMGKHINGPMQYFMYGTTVAGINIATHM